MNHNKLFSVILIILSLSSSWVLQRVAVEGVMQSFDVLVNRFSSAVMNRSVQIVSVLLQAFKQYTQDEDNVLPCSRYEYSGLCQ